MSIESVLPWVGLAIMVVMVIVASATYFLAEKHEIVERLVEVVPPTGEGGRAVASTCAGKLYVLEPFVTVEQGVLYRLTYREIGETRYVCRAVRMPTSSRK